MKPTAYTKIPAAFKKKKLSILLPFLNEQDVIVANARKVLDISAEWDMEVEVVLIDDGSSDSSYALLEKTYKKEPRIKLVRNHQNFGKGWALKTGYEFSTGDLILFLDSDLELSPRHLPNFLRIMQAERSDLVIGSKRHPDSELDYPLKRKIMSSVYYIVIRLLFGLPVKDTQTGIKLFKREALEKALPRLLVKRFAFDIELLLLMVKYKQKIAIAPIELNFSRVAAGRMKLKTIFNMLWDTMAIFYRNTFLRFYDRPIGPNKRYSYTFILFSRHNDDYEKKSLERYLSINYTDYKVIYCGEKDLGLKHKNLSFVQSDLLSYSERFQEVLKKKRLNSDYLIFSSLDSYPDERYLFPTGRLLSLPDVEAVGGFLTLSLSYSEFELQSYFSLRSIFLNAHLSYRYKALHTRETRELPLDGLIVKADSLKDMEQQAHKRLEHILCQHILNKGKKILYVPDLMLYRRFPASRSQYFGVLRHHARTRGSLRSMWTLGMLLSGLLMLGGIGLAVAFRGILWAIPAIGFYTFMLLSRVVLYGFKRGFTNFLLLSVSQFVYSVHFIKGFVLGK